MLEWTYNPEDFREENYGLIPEGKHRVRIEDAQEKVSRSSGRDMIELTLSVSGYSSKLWSYQVLDRSDREHERQTNQRLGTIYNSFNIPHGELDLSHWIGHSGGAMIRHRKRDDGTERAEIAYFLYRKEVEKLPDWHEAGLVMAGNIDPDMADFDGSGEASKIPF